ncbi:MAG: hypothetical protein JWN85_2977 [Gammaproteobacteria bacterium]|nr:hypothetical protein [Gammaproteobacteria bacterium]
MGKRDKLGWTGVGILLIAGAAQAQDDSAASSRADADSGSGWFRGLDVTFGGFVRAEAAVKTDDQQNANNQRGNPFDRISVARQAYVPPYAAGVLGIPPTGLTWTSIPVSNVPGAITGSDSVQRPIDPSNNAFNWHVLRAEGELGVKLTNDLKFIARVRALGDFGHYGNFDGSSLGGINGGITGGDPALYGGAPNYFDYRVDGSKRPNPLEWGGRNYMVDFPTLVLDYNHGPLNVRVGNQAIAWGQAIFFRVLDVVDGLDLRRHSVLDYAQEEFSDKRVPALGARIGYQVTDDILADAYVQKFQPTVYGNPNTQYNVIPVQFTVHDRYSDGGYDKWDKLSAGLRLKANFGQWGFQAIGVRRYNPDGAIRWSASGVNKDLPSTTSGNAANGLGVVVNAANGGHAGPFLAQTPFEASPGGVYSAAEWFHYAGLVRLDGIGALNAAVNDFAPATAKVFASPAANYAEAYNELNSFFIAAGGSLRGHIEREYFQETVLGAGVSYVTEGEPGSMLDQLIINLEASYVPERVYTSPTLGKDFLRENASVGALVVEKNYRFSQSFPATYLVFQYMFRTHDDLFGRSLRGYGATDTYSPGATTGTPGVHHANYLAFALQQPFPQDIYRIGLAVLADPRGGILVQPGLQYKPSGHWAIDGFYTYISDRLGGNPNNNVMGGMGFGNEFSLRVAYQF